MARVTTNGRPRVPKVVEKILDVLESAFKEYGITVQVGSDPVAGTGTHEVAILSPKFRHMGFFERHAWADRVAKRVLTEEQRRRIHLMIVLTPAEFEGKG